MASSHQAEQMVSKGVDELITRLRQEGVSAGELQAEALVEQAKQEAKHIVEAAQKQADQKLADAQSQSEKLLSSGEQALKTAMRDMVLTLKSQLTAAFSQDVSRLVASEMQSADLLKALIIELAGSVASDASLQQSKSSTLRLPKTALVLQELQAHPEELDNSELTGLVFGLTQDMLRKGVTFSVDDNLQTGLKVRLDDQDVIIDFSDEAVAQMLLAHLQPRFRALLEGVVK